MQMTNEILLLPFLPVNIFCFENQIHIKTNDVYRSRFNASKLEYNFLGVHFQSAFSCFCCHFRAVCKYIKKQMIYFWHPIFFVQIWHALKISYADFIKIVEHNPKLHRSEPNFPNDCLFSN